MNDQASELLEKVRQQFETAPYPRIPLDKSPKDDVVALYTHNLVTADYVRNRWVTTSAGKVILDAGCGSGYTSLVLAEANPGAKIIGVDLSEESVKLARQRLHYHGFENTEFYAIPLEELPKLNIQADYINADEVLYLVPDAIAALKAMKAVLKPEGIIRTNLHSSLQRDHFFRAQKFFKMAGLMDTTAQDEEIALVRATMRTVRDDLLLKMTTWKPEYEVDDERIRANFLLQGDKGFTVLQLFEALRAADLEFISMVQWRQWNLLDLFKDVNELPLAIALTFAEKPLEEQLHLFELLHPIHRLLDFWCGHPGQTQPSLPLSEWDDTDWQDAQIYLHPQLQTEAARQDLIRCLQPPQMFEISRHLPIPEGEIKLDSLLAACLFPLWDAPQPMRSLISRWLKLSPVQPVSLEPTTEAEALEILKQNVSWLEGLGYLLVSQGDKG